MKQEFYRSKNTKQKKTVFRRVLPFCKATSFVLCFPQNMSLGGMYPVAINLPAPASAPVLDPVAPPTPAHASAPALAPASVLVEYGI